MPFYFLYARHTVNTIWRWTSRLKTSFRYVSLLPQNAFSSSVSLCHLSEILALMAWIIRTCNISDNVAKIRFTFQLLVWRFNVYECRGLSNLTMHAGCICMAHLPIIPNASRYCAVADFRSRRQNSGIRHEKARAWYHRCAFPEGLNLVSFFACSDFLTDMMIHGD